MSFGLTLGVPGTPEVRMCPHSGYFLVCINFHNFRLFEVRRMLLDVALEQREK